MKSANSDDDSDVDEGEFGDEGTEGGFPEDAPALYQMAFMKR